MDLFKLKIFILSASLYLMLAALILFCIWALLELAMD